jgi:hypothetical protein
MLGSSRGSKSQVTVKPGTYTLEHVGLRLPTYVSGNDDLEVLNNNYGVTINTFGVGDEYTVIDMMENSLVVNLSKVLF